MSTHRNSRPPMSPSRTTNRRRSTNNDPIENRRGSQSNSSSLSNHEKLPHALYPISSFQENEDKLVGNNGNNHCIYEPHYSYEACVDGLTQGTLLVGSLRMNAKNRHEAFGSVTGLTKDVYFDGEFLRNRALDGDIVIIELYDQDAWNDRKPRTNNRLSNASDLSNEDPDHTTTEEVIITNGIKTLSLEKNKNNGSFSSSSSASSSSTVLPSGEFIVDPTITADDTPALSQANAKALAQNLWQPAVPIEFLTAPQNNSSSNSNSISNPRSTTLSSDGTPFTPVCKVTLPSKVPELIVNVVNGIGYQTALASTNTLVQETSKQPVGKVVAILQKNHGRRTVGILSPGSDSHDPSQPIPGNHSSIRLKPTDQRVPYVIIPRTDVPKEYADFFQNPSLYSTTLFAANLTAWPMDSRSPIGHLTQSVGELGDIASETAAALLEQGINDVPFSDDVMQCLQPYEEQCRDVTVDYITVSSSSSSSNTGANTFPKKTIKVWSVPSEEFEQRKDLRSECIFTIDPTTAKDLDDAVHIKLLSGDEEKDPANCIYEIGVHIADVSYFVRPHTALDTEAAKRCTSTYLVTRVIPMLPSLLCEELCSLNPGVDRLAFSIIWKMKGNGELTTDIPWVGRSIIRSVAKLDYNTAQRMIDNEITLDMAKEAASNSSIIPETLWEWNRRPGTVSKSIEQAMDTANSFLSSTVAHKVIPHFSCADVWKDVLRMQNIAKLRRAKRFASGALSLNRAKLNFKLDTDGNPYDTYAYPIRDSNRLVEEYMLLANYFAAQTLVQGVGDRAVLRMHPVLDPALGQKVASIASILGYDLDYSTAGTIHNSLITITKTNPDASKVIEYLVSKQLKPALYFSAGIYAPSTWQHYALAVPYYTHFTSPIRRYADVMVHRLLLEAVDNISKGKLYYTVTTNSSSSSSSSELNDANVTSDDSGKTQLVPLLQSQCELCNDRKKAAKTAQEQCDKVYLTLFVDKLSHDKYDGKGLPMECIVTDVNGSNFFTVVIRGWDVEKRIFVNRCGWKGEFNEETHSLTVKAVNSNDNDDPLKKTRDNKHNNNHQHHHRRQSGDDCNGGGNKNKNDRRQRSNSVSNRSNPANGPPQALMTLLPGQELVIKHLTIFEANIIAIRSPPPIGIEVQLVRIKN